MKSECLKCFREKETICFSGNWHKCSQCGLHDSSVGAYKGELKCTGCMWITKNNLPQEQSREINLRYWKKEGCCEGHKNQGFPRL